MVIADSCTTIAPLVQVLEGGRDIVVAAQLAEPKGAVVHVARLHPDVVILDLPDPACQRAVEQIMGQVPTPILVMVAEGSDSKGDVVRRAQQAGAVEAFFKPAAWSPTREAEFRRYVRLVQGVHVIRHAPARGAGESGGPASPGAGSVDGGPARLVAIAASTGGPAALATVLSGLGGVDAPVLVIQHIHGDFVGGLVAWMDRVAPVPVRLAVAGEVLQPGTVYIGPGGVHLKAGPGPRVVLDSRPPARHCPSADQLFFSVAEHSGADAIGVVLTGMGDDGAEGLLAIRHRGGLTIVQDEATSAVFGMPRAALLAGAATRVLPVGDIAAAVVAGNQKSRA